MKKAILYLCIIVAGIVSWLTFFTSNYWVISICCSVAFIMGCILLIVRLVNSCKETNRRTAKVIGIVFFFAIIATHVYGRIDFMSRTPVALTDASVESLIEPCYGKNMKVVLLDKNGNRYVLTCKESQLKDIKISETKTYSAKFEYNNLFPHFGVLYSLTPEDVR